MLNPAYWKKAKDTQCITTWCLGGVLTKYQCAMSWCENRLYCEISVMQIGKKWPKHNILDKKKKLLPTTLTKINRWMDFVSFFVNCQEMREQCSKANTYILWCFRIRCQGTVKTINPAYDKMQDLDWINQWLMFFFFSLLNRCWWISSLSHLVRCLLHSSRSHTHCSVSAGQSYENL